VENSTIGGISIMGRAKGLNPKLLATQKAGHAIAFGPDKKVVDRIKSRRKRPRVIGKTGFGRLIKEKIK
jgi:hypothetical protein